MDQVVRQVEDYHRHGFQVLGLVGIDRSPSCGAASTTRDGREVPGMGLFVEALDKAMAEKGIPLRKVGIKASRPVEAMAGLADFFYQ